MNHTIIGWIWWAVGVIAIVVGTILETDMRIYMCTALIISQIHLSK